MNGSLPKETLREIRTMTTIELLRKTAEQLKTA